MKINSSRQIFLLISLLAITPFILFLGKNFLFTEFFTLKYFWLAIIYSIFFICVATFIIRFSKNFLILVLFFAYFSFLQFYFHDMQEILRIYKDGSTGFYVLFFIIFISFVAALSSSSSIFTNFVFILLFLNIAISMNNLIPTTVGFLQTFFKTTNIIDSSLNTKKFKSVKYPNIFYIVPDGLASPKILNEYVEIDFKDSIKKFEEKGFNVPEHNYSSYNASYLSLAALFKMDYPITENSPTYKDRSEFYPAIRRKNPELPLYLKRNGYKFIIAPPLWGGCPPLIMARCLEPKANSYIEFFLGDYAIATLLDNSFLKKILHKYLFFQDQKMNDSIKTTLNKMKISPKIWSEGGVFTMIHAMMPHHPYREEDCSITDRYTPPSKEGYKSSVYCLFNRIHELSDYIIKKYPNASIVVQSDHGVYTKSYSVEHRTRIKDLRFVELSGSLIDYRLGNFTAVRGCNSNQAAKLNQVNIVKYIVECLVGGKPPKQLENKSYFGFSENSPDYGKVFRVHQK